MAGGISPAWKHVRIEDVHKPGNTLLWDLIQERAACRLPEGMFEEVEKNFAALIIAAPVTIKARFIEACIENVKTHTSVAPPAEFTSVHYFVCDVTFVSSACRSVVVSLRLLPKLFAQPSQALDRNSVALLRWAENDLDLLRHFFDDLLHYTNQQRHKGVAAAPISLYVK